MADDLFTSDEERLKAQIESDKIGFEAAKVDADLIKGQQDINRPRRSTRPSSWPDGVRPSAGSAWWPSRTSSSPTR